MPKRRAFLAAGAAAPLAVMMAGRVQGAAPSKSTPQPSPAPSPPPSDIALARAKKMREFDKTLTDAQIVEIAKQIDGNDRTHERLNSKKKRLRNADEPLIRFRVPRV